MRKLFFLLFYALPLLSFAQADSLKKLIPLKTGKEKLELLKSLILIDTTSLSLDYYNDALTLAHQLKDPEEEIKVRRAMGDHFHNLFNSDSALYFYKNALSLSRKYKIENEEIICLENFGMVLEELGNYAEAIASDSAALMLCERSGTTKEKSIASEQLGIAFLDLRKYEEALFYFNKELAIDQQSKDSVSLSACLSNIGILYYDRGDYANSIFNYKKATEIKKKLHDENAVAQIEVNIGIAYRDEGTYDLALQNLLKAAIYFEKKQASMELASCYTTIGNIQEELGNSHKALDYHFSALQIRKNIGYKRGIAGSLTNIGISYKSEGKYALALDYLNRSLKLKEELGDKVLIASSLDLIGEVFFLQKNFEQAENYYEQSLKIKEEIEDPKGTASTLNNFGELYVEWKKYDLAISNLEKGRKIALEMGAKKTLLKNYEISVKAYRGKGDYSNALSLYDQYTSLKDSLLNEQKNKALSELQIKYETEKNQHKIELLSETEKTNVAELSKEHTLIYSLVTGIILLLIIALLSLVAYRSRRKAYAQSQLLVRQKQVMIEQKQTMMRELHHRVKNNLQVLVSLLNLQQIRLSDSETKTALKEVEQRLHAMLLIHRELYQDEEDATVNMSTYITKLTDNLLSSFGYSKDHVKINLQVEEVKLDADKALNVGFICNEIISNSFKHAFPGIEKPELSIAFRSENKSIHLEISDNGSGIPGGVTLENANSFGLRLIQLFMKDMNGNISITSDTSGSNFIFIIPKNIS